MQLLQRRYQIHPALFQQIIRWVDKALASPRALTVMLVPGDSSTKASQRMLYEATAILFLKERIKFDSEKSGAKFASWLALFNGTVADSARLRRIDLGFVLAHAPIDELRYLKTA
jgi:hypothetical protein